jgi:valyl-tRNA synthetase
MTGDVPFRTVYTHGLILDNNGQKMSKSKGNVVDPMGLLDTYGADALRLTMASIASAEDMRFSEQKVEQSRNFCTKLWNAARFMELQGVRTPVAQEIPPEAVHPVNRWMISELKNLISEVNLHLEKYEFNQLAQTLYHFTWGTWCDWYLELSKPLLNGEDGLAEETRATMGWGFGVMLKVLHPVTPFITEELWQALSQQLEQPIITSMWPDNKNWQGDQQAKQDVNWLLSIIGALRQVRAETRVSPKVQVELVVRDGSDELVQKLSKFQPFLEALAGVSTISTRVEPPEEGEATAVVNGVEYILPLAGVIDFSAEKERIRREIDKASQELAKVSALLKNDAFLNRAAPNVVEQNHVRQAELEENILKLRQIVGG